MHSINFLIALVTISATVPAIAGNWFQISGGGVELDLNEQGMEDNLWLYLDQNSTIGFRSREEYNYQFQVTETEDLYINAFCNSLGESNLDLQKYFLVVDGGGSCYFQIKFDGSYHDLTVNDDI